MSFKKNIYSLRLEGDTAWHPVWREEVDSSPALRKAIILGYGPLRPWMSIAHWYVMYGLHNFFFIT